VLGFHRAHPILVMQVHLPGTEYGWMERASTPPARESSQTRANRVTL